MNTGRQLGLQLRLWIEAGELPQPAGQALVNRWIDALGRDDSLKAPLRDLAARPLFLQALKLTGPTRRASLEQLRQELGRIYSPAVMGELVALLEGFSGDSLGPPPSSEPPPAPVATSSTVVPMPAASASLQQLQLLAPGIALSAGAALVGMWLGHELEQLMFRDWGWNGSVVLILSLALVELGKLSPLGGWLQRARLSTRAAGSEAQSWRWLLAPWLHPSRAEAVLCLLLLVVVLGPSPLPLGAVILRYLLTSLAALIPALLIARRAGLERTWGGSAGVVGALIGLGAALSLLQGRALAYRLGGEGAPLDVPAWVLLLVFATAEIIRTTVSWEREGALHHNLSRRQRLLTEPWIWGLILGTGWGCITWLLQQVERIKPAGGS
jgi:hypothetical protein